MVERRCKLYWNIQRQDTGTRDIDNCTGHQYGGGGGGGSGGAVQQVNTLAFHLLIPVRDMSAEEYISARPPPGHRINNYYQHGGQREKSKSYCTDIQTFLSCFYFSFFPHVFFFVSVVCRLIFVLETMLSMFCDVNRSPESGRGADLFSREAESLCYNRRTSEQERIPKVQMDRDVFDFRHSGYSKSVEVGYSK